MIKGNLTVRGLEMLILVWIFAKISNTISFFSLWWPRYILKKSVVCLSWQENYISMIRCCLTKYKNNWQNLKLKIKTLNRCTSFILILIGLKGWTSDLKKQAAHERQGLSTVSHWWGSQYSPSQRSSLWTGRWRGGSQQWCRLPPPRYSSAWRELPVLCWSGLHDQETLQ